MMSIMKNLFLLSICICGALATGFAQDATLVALVEQLGTELPKAVPTTRNEVEQSLTYDEAAPYRITVTQVELARKRSEEVVAEINLGLVRRARTDSERGSMGVMLTGFGTPIARITEDGEPEGYEEEFRLLAESPGDARSIEGILAKILPLAASQFEADNALPTDETALRGYISERIGEAAAADGDGYAQTLSFDAATQLSSLTREALDDGDGATYNFYFSDLSARGISIDERSDLLELTVETDRGVDFIEEVETDGDRSFSDEVNLYFIDLQRAAQAKAALEALIPLASARVEAAQKQYPSTTEAASALTELVGAAQVLELEQSMSGGCDAVVTAVESGRTVEEHIYSFSFSDLDARRSEISARRGALGLTVPTRRDDDLITHTEDGVPDGFADELALSFGDPAAARAARRAVTYLSETCSGDVAAPSQTEWLALLTLPELDEGETQQAASFGETPCDLLITQVEARGSRVEEMLYEVNLGDLDVRSIALSTRGSAVSLEVTTIREEELIRETEDGEDVQYTDELPLRVTGLKAAKQVRAGLEAMIEGCSR